MKTSILENKISKDKNILLLMGNLVNQDLELHELLENFCGRVVNHLSQIQQSQNILKIYACGDFLEAVTTTHKLHIIQELSTNYEPWIKEGHLLVTLGEVPIIVSDAGVYFRNLFPNHDYFHQIKSEHEFQHLTESNKESKAFRTGIYLTEVVKEEKENTELLHFNLLRCSSNFTGPTDNLRATDLAILRALNDAITYIFEKETKLNHVLAQIYENKKNTEGSRKEIKSKIKAHSDKTKDMPNEGIIAFCTFYDSSSFAHLKPSNTDRYDWCYKQKTGLTTLHFKLKDTVKEDHLAKAFSVTLYPNAVFLIPLSTNRLYTHEIKPSMLNIDQIPVRMGYVVRCSNVEAVYMNHQTYLKENGNFIKLEPMTEEFITQLRNSYFEENATENFIEYGKVHFSMNLGDYEKPIY